MERLWKALRIFWRHFFRYRCSRLAASLAYTSLLTMVPMLLLMATIAAHLPFAKDAMPVLQRFIFQNFVASTSSVVIQYIDHFLMQLKLLSWSTIVAFVFVFLLMMYNLVRAFNTVWQVEVSRQIVVSMLAYLLMLVLAPVLFGVLIFISSYVASISIVKGHIESPMVVALPYIAAFIFFSFLQWGMPTCKVKIRYALISGFVTTVLFEAARIGFKQYLKHFPTYKIIYGALATVPIFLVWIYLSWMIIIIGAALCCTLHQDL
ncbi:MAG: YihY family inner membrane protein [Gammaproteobacteria bacterium]|nr:YihY family inner membrane protein [Gammaproteobacteria bacterium]